MTDATKDGSDKGGKGTTGDGVSVSNKDQAADQSKTKQVQEERRRLKEQGILVTTATRTFGKLDFEEKPQQTTSKVASADVTKKLEADAEAIRKATGNENWVDRRADRQAINQLLQNKTAEEIAQIDQIYQKKYGISLEKEMRQFVTGSDLTKFLNVLQKKDDNVESRNASRLHQDLSELANLVTGRSNSVIEKDIRDTLSSMTAEQVKKVEKEFTDIGLHRMTPEQQSLYLQGETLSRGADAPGLVPADKAKAIDCYNSNREQLSLSASIQNNVDISEATKQAAKIYLETGADKRTDPDVKKLADIAIEKGNLTMFQEAMSSASSTARKEFLDNKGEQRLEAKFSGIDLKQALDYAREGKVSAATQVEANTGYVFKNDQGIELAISRLTAQERKMYQDGKQLSQGKEVPGISPDQGQAAQQFYGKLHSALEGASNKTNVVKWEAMIGDGESSLVASLARHRGIVRNSGSDEIYKDIENITKAQWDDAKKHPERREQLQEQLKSLNRSPQEIERMLSYYDQKTKVETYEESKGVGRQPLDERIKDKVQLITMGDSNSRAVIEMISKMTPEEQARYRTDKEFQTKVDKSVRQALSGPDLNAAREMLGQVSRQEAPIEDPLYRLQSLQPPRAKPSAAEVGVFIDDLEKTFQQNPNMRQRIANPQTPEDIRYSEQFEKAARAAVPAYYNQLVRPVVETGHAPLENKLALYKGAISNDLDKIVAEVAKATAEEKARIKQDPEYAAKILGGWSEKEKPVVQAALEQGTLKPEDKIRISVLTSGGSSNLVAELKGLRSEDLAKVEREYARKYGSSLDGDVLTKLDGQERIEAQRVLNSGLSVPDRADLARDEAQKTRSGVGAYLADNVFRSATGAQADDAQNQLVKAVTDQNKLQQALADNPVLKSLPPEQVQKLQKQLEEIASKAVKSQEQATDNFADSKRSAGEVVANTAIAAATITALIVQPELSIPLVLKLGAAGAAIKVSTSATLEGSDYEGGIERVSKDATSGFIGAVANAIGPGEIAAAFQVGRLAAKEAVQATITQIATQGTKAVLKDGGEQLLEDGLKTATREALISGASSIDRKTFASIAEKAVDTKLEGKAREQAVSDLAQTLEQNFQNKLGSATSRYIEQQALNTSGGAVGGAASGFGDSVMEWDQRKTFGENLAAIADRVEQGALGGGIGAAAASAAAEGLGRAFRAAREKASTEGGVATPEVRARQGQSAASPETSTAQGPFAGRAQSGDNVDATEPAKTKEPVERTSQKAEPAEQPTTKPASKEQELAPGVRRREDDSLGTRVHDTPAAHEPSTAHNTTTGDGPTVPESWEAVRESRAAQQNWPDNIRQDSEPPVPEGYTRLYRGVQPQAVRGEFAAPIDEHEVSLLMAMIEVKASGGELTPEQMETANLLYAAGKADNKFYTDVRQTAAEYAGPAGKLIYVDVPQTEVTRLLNISSNIQGEGFGNGFNVPYDYHRNAREIP